MNDLFRFNKVYFGLAVFLFITEILIACYVHDAIIRPYIGDLLVVILLYTFIRAFLNTPTIQTAIAVLLFSYFIETMQYFNVVRLLGMQDSNTARTIIGVSFEWIDIIAYTAGIALVLATEYITRRTKK